MATKPFEFPKRLVWESYQRVKANRGAAGIDAVSIDEFDRDQSRNLYRIWNRLSSGSYFPPAVKAVPIPKKSGGTRTLGVPTVGDRIAQTAVVLVLEPLLEPVFHPDSYGYRPGKSAHDAIAVTRQRCWQRDWVLEYDIRGLFDNIDHHLLLRALRHHCDEPWVLLHVQRWLTAPMKGAGRGNEFAHGGDAARRSAVADSRQPVSALCPRSLAGPNASEHSVLSLCR
jgi:RNA-directed DNA polymerase